MTTAGSTLTRALDSYRAAKDSPTELQTTGQFINAHGEQCAVRLIQQVTTPTDSSYFVRTLKTSTVRNGAGTKTVTEQTAEEFHGLQAATRAYNWSLYLLAATEQDSARLTLPL